MAFVDVLYVRARGIGTRPPHLPHVKAVCHRRGIDCWYPQSLQVSNTSSAKHEKHVAFTASSATGFGIMQSGQVR
jgi:hypothetical protein